MILSGKKLCDPANQAETFPSEPVVLTGPAEAAERPTGGTVALTPDMSRGPREAKEATVSRAKGRTRVWRATALLAGALTHFVGGEAQAFPAVNGAPAIVRPAGNPTYGKAQARSKLLQARTYLLQGNFDAAEALAGEVARQNITWAPGEDSPARLQQELTRSRTDPHLLVLAARHSLTAKDYLKAEQYARAAEKKSGYFTFPIWGDSPGKVLRDVETARRSGARGTAVVRKDAPRPLATPDKQPTGKTVAAQTPARTPAPGAKNPIVQTTFTAPATDRASTVPPAISTTAPQTPPPLDRSLVKGGTSAVNTAKLPGPMPAAPVAAPAKGSESDEARSLIKQARLAIANRKYDEARTLASRARTRKASLGWWEDNPDRIEADLKRLDATHQAQAAVVQATPKTTAPSRSATTPAVPRTKEAARAMLAEARQHLAAGKMDDAAQTAQRVKAMSSISWGLFEDSPDRLALDIEKARARRDRLESDRLLAEGRKLYEKGDYEGSARLAYRAQKLHGTYSIWELGDRPSKLLADIQTAQARSRKTALPPPVVARRDDKTGRPTTPTRTGTTDTALAGTAKPAPTMPAGPSPEKLRAQQLVAEAQRLHREGKLADARQKVEEARRLRVTFAADETSPEFVDQQLAIEVRHRIDGLVRQAETTLSYGKGDGKARTSEAEKRLEEARGLAASFGQDVRPIENRLADLRRQDSGKPAGSGTAVALVKHESPTPAPVPTPGPVPTPVPLPPPPGAGGMTPLPVVQVTPPVPSENPPVPAVAAAPTTPPVPADAAPGTPPVPAFVAAPATPPAPVVNEQLAHCQQMLEQGRIELRKGDTGSARRLAEQALLGAKSGPDAVREEAMALLRTIDVEEFNQKRLTANRAFDAALAAYRRREFNRASSMLAAIDTRLLDEERQGRLREVNLTPEMSPSRPATTTAGKMVPPTEVARTQPEPTPAAPTGVPTPLPGVPADGLGGSPEGQLARSGEPAGRSTTSDAADGGLLDIHRQRQKILFDKLRQDGLEVQREAADKFRAGQQESALEMLQDHLAKLSEEKLEPGQLTVLRRPVESRLSHFRLLKAQKELASGTLAAKQASTDRIAAGRRAEETKQKNVEKLMKDFNNLFKEGKYLEAESLAMRALELDPDNGVASAAVYMARRQRDVSAYKKIKDGRERMVLEGLNDAEDEGPAGAIKSGVSYDKERWERASKRKGTEPIKLGRISDKTKAIERQLTTPISISFDNTPLRQVLDELRDVHGINIVPDKPALDEAGVSLESPISIKLDRVSLKSALNLILHQVRLTHVIKDEVLQITTEEHARGKLVAVTYSVADLVIPVENFGDIRGTPGPNVAGGAGAGQTTFAPTPVVGVNGMISGSPVGAPLGSGGSMLNSGPGGMSTGSSGGVGVTKKSASNTTEEQLIKLVTSTIGPRTWSEMGGPGTIDYHPLTMSLVINQTPDIQEQIQDLLQALRRLQDQEVAVEVRFISVSEDFFERIGVNFNMNFLTDKGTTRFEPALLNNSFVVDSSRFINAFDPKRFIAGMTPAGSLTPTLDIPITNNSFFQTVPQFGGYTAGGLSMGLAFLSDIQVFLFLEAVQGDQRANVMQAPKLTLFNGQTASLNVGETQSFVSGVQVAQLPGGQFVLVPQNTPVPFGVFLTIQAVISADRRFVRLSLPVQLTNLVPGPIQAFPVVVPIFTSIEGNQAGQPVTFTQYLQQPSQTFVSVQTTVAVPDGGTVLMGGLKRLSEARSEYGPPILSKVPYINRLFKNVGYGRETDSMLIMVTPRIIIQEEEQEMQTGFRESAAITGGTP